MTGDDRESVSYVGVGKCEFCGLRETWEHRLVECDAAEVVARRLDLGLEK